MLTTLFSAKDLLRIRFEILAGDIFFYNHMRRLIRVLDFFMSLEKRLLKENLLTERNEYITV